ncbi:asparaginase [Natronococcus amylolyticus DSM 10524]|uniref:L-asparaginase n=1 Tax=Natronococcus amylolyticus DSM 10524 TaxID=1227497 RepID=L9X6G0_9EURY|nr:asparaginase [Natronococcus amylolyticus]ELY57197.1 asparaginase [Natronococcus amylolyticus DSM 10524]
MPQYDADRRSFMQLAGIAGGATLTSNATAASDEMKGSNESDERREDDGTEVQVLSMGGTIASTPGDGGASPSESGEALIESVPELEEYADEILVDQVTQLGSFNLEQEHVAELGEKAREVEDVADGIVVTHGTDTMEESAYHLDLALELALPIVFTGAQRRPDEVSTDGPANLVTSFRAAAHDEIRSGVYIAFNEELHAARDVTKAHTRKLETFESPDKGPIAQFTRDDVRLYREPGSYAESIDALRSEKTVPIVASGQGMSDRQLRFAIEEDADGIVLDGFGLGNTSETLSDAVRDAIESGIPVVVTSRSHAGPLAAIYGNGGGETLRDHGAISGDDLPAHKARIKLLLALEASDDPERVRSCFGDW